MLFRVRSNEMFGVRKFPRQIEQSPQLLGRRIVSEWLEFPRQRLCLWKTLRRHAGQVRERLIERQRILCSCLDVEQEFDLSRVQAIREAVEKPLRLRRDGLQMPGKRSPAILIQLTHAGASSGREHMLSDPQYLFVSMRSGRS